MLYLFNFIKIFKLYTCKKNMYVKENIELITISFYTTIYRHRISQNTTIFFLAMPTNRFMV